MSGQETMIPAESPPTAPPGNGTVRLHIHPAWVALFLALVTLAVYWPVINFEFINYDDDDYVVDNLTVRQGLSLHGVVWAFRSFHASNWHPLTWMSHMADCQFWGLNAGPHHLTNVLFHAANAALLFLLLRLMTGALWRSAMVAALFALHPLHVESVAWVSERKDVLSAFFGFLSLLFYARYVESKTRNSKLEIRSPKSEVFSLEPSSILHAPSWLSYFLALFFFACGLMSKPMLVTWPFLMLLLDWWPLKRISSFKFRVSNGTTPAPRFAIRDSQFAIGWRLILEKAPFFALSLASCVVTYVAQSGGGAVKSTASVPVGMRLANVFVSYARYLGKTFWPADLAIFYPFYSPVEHWTMVLVVLAVVLVLGGSLAALWFGRRRPYLAIGWFWFLGMLVPVIGLVQVGAQSMADRYTYLPLVGVFILLVWGVGEMSSRWRLSPVLVGVMGMMIVLACAWRTADQVQTWRNSGTLFRHALAATGINPLADESLGIYLFKQGQRAEAISHLRKALKASPYSLITLNSLGLALASQGQVAEAITCYRKALKIKPDFPSVWNNLGLALIASQQYTEAIDCFKTVLRKDPDNPQIHFTMGIALSKAGRLDDAIQEYRWVLQHAPEISGVQQQLGMALLKKGEAPAAVGYLRAAVRLNPESTETLNSLAWVLATSSDAQLRNGVEAVTLAERAVQVTHSRNPAALDTLAAAYAEAGRFPEAVVTAQKALELAEASGKETLVNQIRGHLESYKSGHPCRE